VGCNKASRRGGMLGLLNLRQGSGVPPDSGKTVLRSRLGRNYRQLPTSERPREPPAVPKSSANRISGDTESDLAAETRFLSRRLSCRRLLLVDFPNCDGYVPSGSCVSVFRQSPGIRSLPGWRDTRGPGGGFAVTGSPGGSLPPSKNPFGSGVMRKRLLVRAGV
jgi:hypothetical protein